MFQIDVEEEECMEVDEYLGEDEEVDETSNSNEEEDLNTETLTETEKDTEQSLGDSETIEEKREYSDGWLYEEDTFVNEDEFCSPSSSAADQQIKDVVVGPSGPDVKVSAITGVGLQELMELIDKKLSSQEEELKPSHVVERNVFDRKWRPSWTQDSSITVEQ